MTRSIASYRRRLVSSGIAVVSTALLVNIALGDQILETNDASLTTYLASGPTNVQDIAPIHQQRGVNLDGSLRHSPTMPMNLAGNPFGEGWNRNISLSGLRLDTGTFVITDVDLALPSDGFSWVIARSYNAQQDDSGHHDSDGYQGRNWFQMSQPEIILHDDDSNPSTREIEDTLYLVYGADRYIEFKRIEDNSDEFKSKNGAAGGMFFEEGAGNEPDTYTYTDQNGNKFEFFGFDDDASPAKGSFWRATTPAHPSGTHVTYVGDASTGSTAITNGYDSSTGAIWKAYDATDRRYTYTYQTYDSVKRLTKVVAETKTGGTWQSPTGVTEVGKVQYDYYRTGGNTTYGDNGCLELVTITTPLTDATIDFVKNKYYRYWKGTFDDSTNPGHPYSLQYIVEAEGTRNFDWSDETFDADYEGATETNLKPYAAASFEYDSSHRVDKAWFNGACGCGGAANGVHEFEYETNSGHPGNADYDEQWKKRTTIKRPDGSYVVQYFDELGQPLTRVVADGDPDITSGRSYWVTEVIRNDPGTSGVDGTIQEIRTPEANASYTHSSASIGANNDAGLITTFTYTATGTLSGFRETVKHQKGDDGTEYFDLKLTTDGSIGKDVSAYTPTVRVNRPVITQRITYSSETDSDTGGTDTDLSYTAYTNELFLQQIDTTLPAVTTANNGSNSSNTRVVYLRRDGTTVFAEAEDDIFTYTAFTDGQLTKRIDDVKLSGTFPSGDDPFPDWGITENSNGVDRTTTITYDAQGRPDETTLPSGRVTKMYYTDLKSERPITISIPKVTTGPTTYYGPVSYTVSNHSGRLEFSGAIAFSGGTTTTALTAWIDEDDDTYKDDPIKAVDTGTVERMSTNVMNEPGTTLEESRAYFTIPASGAGTSSANYDPTIYQYDDSGRTKSVEDATGTIRKTVYDAIGRASEQWVGTVDGGGSDNMVKTSKVEYDSDGVGNGLVTKRTLDADGDWGTGGDQRETTYENDLRGRGIVQNNPNAPHVLNKFDNRSRLTATGLYSATTGLDISDDPTSLTTNRMALSQSFYDEMGRVWKSQVHKIDDADGSDDDNLQTLTWFDAPGRVIKIDGQQLMKTSYDRLGRQTHQFILANDNDTGYTDADDLIGDIAVNEFQTVYESNDSDNVIMTVAIERLYDDKGVSEDTDTLDSNDDNDDDKITQANVAGRVQITSSWYDNLDRLEDTAVLGTNGGSDYDRSGETDPPTRSDNDLRTTYVYYDDGDLKSITDPANLKTQFEYDDRGQRITVIANYVNGTPSGSTGDDDIHTRFVYTDGLQTKMWADIDGDGTEDSGTDQVTTYTFGVSTSDTDGPSDITVNHLLRKVTYPDSGGATDVVLFGYNALQQQDYTKDQAGNVMEFDYDTSGRRTAEKATTVKTADGFSGWVKRIAWAFDSLSRVSTVTQYDAASAGNVVNEVKNTYDDWGNVSKFEQDHDSTVATGGNQLYDVDYAYEKATAGRNTIRRSTMDLPSTNTITFTYSSFGNRHDDELSRVTKVKDEGVSLARYWYNGAGHVVGVEYLEASVQSLQYSGSTFPDLDRFNRVTTSKWTKDLATDKDFFDLDITYNRNSNITLVEDNIHAGFDVDYTIDNLNRLTDAQEGTWSGGSITSETRQQTWTLDQLGNWATEVLDQNNDGDGYDTDETDEKRTHNVVNELTDRDIENDGLPAQAPDYDDVQYDLTYDKVGNLTDDIEDYKYVYDVWGRLVELKPSSGFNVVAKFEYNGLHHRTLAHYDTDTDGDVDANDTKLWLAYTERWQLVAAFEDTDTTPKEEWIYHNAGASGLGSSSYIDDVIARDRNANTGSPDLEERTYFCQNWRHDVVALVTDTGKMLEWVNYTSYGIPFGLPAGDTNSDGDWDSSDATAISVSISYDVREDAELDGDVDSADTTHANSITGGYQTLQWNVLSSTGVKNYKGYAGYEWDRSAPELYHVRNRVLNVKLGRWTRRDPLGYVDGANKYTYSLVNPVNATDPSGMISEPFFQDNVDVGCPLSCVGKQCLEILETDCLATYHSIRLINCGTWNGPVGFWLDDLIGSLCESVPDKLKKKGLWPNEQRCDTPCVCRGTVRKKTFVATKDWLPRGGNRIIVPVPPEDGAPPGCKLDVAYQITYIVWWLEGSCFAEAFGPGRLA